MIRKVFGKKKKKHPIWFSHSFMRCRIENEYVGSVAQFDA